MLALADNNFVQRDGLREYLDASPENRVAIPHTVFVEWHKGDAAKVTRRVLQHACAYPKRIVILRDTHSILRMRGQPKRIMMKLIDEQQTRDFPAYCSDFITSPLTPDVVASFAAHAERARNDVDALQGEAHKMLKLFAAWDERFTPRELRELHGLLERDNLLSDGLQIKTWAIAEVLARQLLKEHGLARIADYPGELVNTLAFRYGATTIGLYVRMRNRPGDYPTKDRKVLAHLMDVKIAAQGTYFDDFLTHEDGLKQAYEVAMSLIRALGGFTRCGRPTG
ncbi:hypothetical protein [Sphingomonas yantingensis]|uniref:Uncharacterized protein n=1 Tax=Sphingomonas yantingensis TaxID=1241761 RepID=A0A7W9EJA3_9SPHN|nr:hypothetical protein [Sphingomonas yantingensis]MBB5700033.1 hypothetical protein [Sphingomonas yantingensis]